MTCRVLPVTKLMKIEHALQTNPIVPLCTYRKSTLFPKIRMQNLLWMKIKLCTLNQEGFICNLTNFEWLDNMGPTPD